MFGIGNKTKRLVTHSGSFHADDIFACATLELVLESKGEKFEITRTRDQEEIKSADYVFDVGGVYDEASNRFDHHQAGGAGTRLNGIEYASFGLVWKKFGLELSKFKKVLDLIDKKLVAPIDAGDNAISLVELKTELLPYFIQHAFNSFRPTWKNLSDKNLLLGFLESVKIAKAILKNEINKAQSIVEAEEFILSIYQSTTDKRIIVLDKKYPWEEQIQNYPEPIFVVYPRVDNTWGVEGVAASKFSFDKRKNFPTSWAGLRDQELQKASEVDDAIFCHRALFMAVAKSKDGAVTMAQIALESSV